MVSQQISTATSPALEHPIRSRPKIPLMRPIVDEEMIQAAVEALRNERLVMGESVFKFEEEFARYCGTRHAISTASGTAALQIGLQALGVGPGDLVITTPFTFIASSNAVLHAGARPEFADVDTVAETAKSLRDCGRASKYTMSRIGYTSRLNTVNAAIGRVQLRKLDRWNLVRRRLASRYRKGLQDVGGITLPPEDNPGAKSVYHLFVIRYKNRDELAKKLQANGIESMVHYPVPSHLQTPYRRLYGFTEGMFPVSERLAGEVLSLPLYPEMPDEDVDRVCQVIRDNSTGQA